MMNSAMTRIALALGALLLPGLPALAQTAGGCALIKGHPIVRPIMATHTQPPYPQPATQMQEQGNTLLRVDIGADGVPTNVTVDKTSGAMRLDRSAIQHIKTNWKWQPTLDADCMPVAITTRVSVDWHLLDRKAADGLAFTLLAVTPSDYPAGAAARKEQGFVTLAATVLPNGTVTQIKVRDTSGYPDLDDRAVDIAKARFHPRDADLKDRTGPSEMGIVVAWVLPLPARK